MLEDVNYSNTINNFAYFAEYEVPSRRDAMHKTLHACHLHLSEEWRHKNVWEEETPFNRDCEVY